MTTRKNASGRDYKKGDGISSDLRKLIVQETLHLGGNVLTGEIPRGVFTKVAEKYKVNRQTVTNFWRQYVSDGALSEKTRNTLGRPKLNTTDIEMIHFFKKDRPSITGTELKQKLIEYSPVSGKVDTSTIYRTMSKKLDLTYKRITRPSCDRFSQHNMVYTQAYMDFCKTVRPCQVKFMDESGFKITTTNSNYGHSKKGVACVEIGKFHPGRNLTLNLVVGLNGVIYYNFVDGPSNMNTYLNFWNEASLSQDRLGRSAFLPGDVVVVDNCAIHHNNAEIALSQFFQMQGVGYTFLPVYSPDLNPVENCFAKIKSLMTQERFRELASVNLKLSIIRAIEEITPTDMKGFYRHTGCFNV
ncbi:uncharacterized protein LOC117334303 [Pecten maximus]|uniref:uncharacterized protein LOC117334303 n=1 Tax=Pecten maximus TaxID=6579 RepID=UPI001459036B|nr:uncharacterized protein LOC117334303 [Pecten maximus]